MSDENITKKLEEAEKTLKKGKIDETLAILREIDTNGDNALTCRIAGEAIWQEAKASKNRAKYRQAARLLREAVNKNPRDKKSGSLYNDLLNEMQTLRISETTFPRLINNGMPTFAGAVALIVASLVFLAAIKVMIAPVSGEAYEATMTISWTDSSGTQHTEDIVIDLFYNDAPIAVENFATHAEDQNFDNTIFHRIIDGFMIQGGDFTNSDGTGGHANSWQGYCNGQAMEDSASCPVDQWTIPDEADNGKLHGPGALAMAKTSAPDTGGSQFYIVPSDSKPSHLDGVHTVFGKVSSGLGYVDSISEVTTAAGDKPVHDVTIEDVQIKRYGEDKPFWQFW